MYGTVYISGAEVIVLRLLTNSAYNFRLGGSVEAKLRISLLPS